MKKKIRFSKKFVSMMLSLILMLTCLPMTVFADERTNAEIVYEGYQEVWSAVASKDYETLCTAVSDFEAEAVDVFNELTEEELTELAALMGLEGTEEETAAEAAYGEMLSVWVDANMLAAMGEVYTAYLNNPNTETAYAFTDHYENIANSGDDYYLYLIMDFYPDLPDDYTDAASTYLPSEKVLYVYQSFLPVQEALEYGNLGGLESAVEYFYDVVEIFNEPEESELEELAALMGADSSEEAYGWLFSDWFDANMILEVADVFYAYVDDSSLENAAAFVEMIGGENGWDDIYDYDRSLLYTFFGEEFDEFYDGAEKIVAIGEVTVEDVYNAMTALQTALESGDLKQLEAAVDGVEAIADAFNAYETEELEELAALMGVEATEDFTAGEAVYYAVLSWCFDANAVLNVAEHYDAYTANPNKETAEAFVELMEAYDESYEDRSLLKQFMPDFDEVYAEALLAGKTTPNEETKNTDTKNTDTTKTTATTTTTNTSSSTKAVNTADNNNIWMWLVLTVMCGSMICGTVVKRKAE